MQIKSIKIIGIGNKNMSILTQIWNEKAKIIKVKFYVEMKKVDDLKNQFSPKMRSSGVRTFTTLRIP